ncbi:MAG TPA: alkaline phosphatase family protein [Candidatus Deferrimicrobium sp.]|nr:alkaline phosphatase family protein [Candidatus Deferrimicrobium sp.]
MRNRNCVMIIFLIFILAFSAILPYISSEIPKKTPSEGIQRVILISIDSCNPEYLSSQFMPNLYSRIIQDGIKFKFANTVLAAETQSGHTTMVTGSYPTHSGIIGNGLYFPDDWEDPVSHEIVYPAGTTISTFTDHRLLLTKTIFEQFQDNDSIQTAFISGKWRLVPLLCEGADLVFGNANNGSFLIPEDYKMKVGAPLTYIEGDAVDIWSMNCLIEVVKNDPQIDFIFVNLAYLDPCQHSYGAYNEMIYHNLRELDNLFLRLFNELETMGEYDSTLFVIVSDHGHDRSDYVINLFDILNDAAPQIGADILAEGQSAYIFLDNQSQLSQTLNLLEAQEGIGLVVPRNNTGLVGYGNYSDYNLYPYRNRTGDIYVCTKQNGAVVVNPNIPFMLYGIHGGPSTQDVILSFICKNMQFKPELQGFEINTMIPNTVDILPTVAQIMNWSLDTMILDGEALDILV